jgi:hypothetical protein
MSAQIPILVGLPQPFPAFAQIINITLLGSESGQRKREEDS